MQIERAQLDRAVGRGIISEAQATALWGELRAEQKDSPHFSFNHLLYYFGGLIAIGGISVFVTLGWEMLGGPGLALVALAVMALGAWLTDYFLHEQKLVVPAGLMAALTVAAAPLAIYGLQRTLGFWSGQIAYQNYHYLIDWRWVVIELGSLAVGAAVLWRWRLPFSVMPIAVTLWFMSMDLAPLLQKAMLGNIDPNSPKLTNAEQRVLWESYWELQKRVSVVVGLVICAGAIAVDVFNRTRRDYAFWLHLAGVTAFWGSLTAMNSNSEVGKFVYFLINFGMLVFGAAIGRRVYTVYGALGIAAYLSYLSHKVFKDSLVFPVMLMLIGLGVVWLGVLWQRHEGAIDTTLQRWLPPRLRTMRGNR